MPYLIFVYFLLTGLKALDEVIEKQSETLGRMAQYQQSSRISRLPSNLTVHMVRFYWRRDINRKAKIMVRPHTRLHYSTTNN